MKSLTTDFKDVKRVGIFGLGISNIGVLRFLSGRGDFDFILRSERSPDRSVTDNFRFSGILTGADAFKPPFEDILFLSPSVNRRRREVAELLAHGVRLTSDAELFFELADRPVFAVTGSDGKSTATELTSLLLSERQTAKKCGNCGVSMLSALSEGADLFVSELSSFMLDGFSPRCERAIITSFSENHLDFHGSAEAYLAAKENIYKSCRECVISADLDFSKSLIKKYKPYAVVSQKRSFSELKSTKAELILTLRDGEIERNGQPMLKISDIRRKESYNIANFMSAMALADGYFSSEHLRDTARSFRGLSHRCESIGVFGGVEYIDSSVDSSPARTAATLEGLGRRVILLLGGRGKGLSYEPLSEPVAKYAAAVIIGGENREEIKCALAGCNIPIYTADTLREQIEVAKAKASFGDTVLLSPASASFDQFENFEERANYFKSQL